MITQNELQKMFQYKNGNLYWNVCKNKNTKVGDLAGTIKKPQNYRSIGIDGKYYYAHRLIFLYHHGYLPKFIDHIDGNVFNNNIQNLRECTQTENAYNNRKSRKNTSGHKNVSYYNSMKKWCGKVTVSGKNIRKFFNDLEEASNWVKMKREELHKEFANHGEL